MFWRTSAQNLEETSFVGSKGSLTGLINSLHILLNKVSGVKRIVKFLLACLEAVKDKFFQISAEFRVQDTTQILACMIKEFLLQNVNLLVRSTANDWVESEFVGTKSLASLGDHVALHHMGRYGKELKGHSKVLAAALTLHDGLELLAMDFGVANGNLAAVLGILRCKSLDDAIFISSKSFARRMDLIADSINLRADRVR
mmetsp:Transcript_7176/g.11908  ORF Transcript_7176/g.11908 Transcript_7176/m.11908 type:complete len:200 (+) Transcript_7176:570-1169(+)